MKKYRNRRKILIVKILKPTCQLTHVAFCMRFWDEHFMAEAAAQLSGGHPT